MSLQLWLPLNGNLNNNGVANATITNSNATVDANGKIGSCYSFNGSTSCIEITCGSFPTFFSGSFSVCMWFYNNDNNDRSILFGNWSMTGSFFNIEKFANNTVRFYWNGTPDISFGSATLTAGAWTHLVVTREGNTVKCYINGELKQTSTTALTGAPGSTATVFRIGRDNRSDATATNGKINDFRLYDHALSPKEVKEISKALILHLPLDNNGAPNPNLLPHTNIGVYGIGYAAVSSSGTIAVDNTTLFNGKPTLKITPSSSSTSSGAWNAYNSSVNLTAGKTYTYSCYIKSSVADTWDFSSLGHYQAYTADQAHNSTDRTYVKQAVPANEWVKVIQKFKCTVNSVFRSFFIYFANTSQTIWISDVKLEEGDTATPWMPHTSDSDYASLGFNTTTVYDTSGYANNGTMWAYDSGGSIEISGDTKRYSVSTYINSNNNTTNTASGTRYIYGSCPLTTPNYLTVAFWCKPIAGYNSTVTQGQFSLTNNNIGADAGYDYQAAPFNHRDGIVDVNGSNGSTHKTVAIGFTANEWHHYAVVYDGRYGRVYKDGVQTSTCDMGSNMALGSMKGAVIGFSRAGGVWRSNKSYYSDFRIYATALSATDIEELYKTSVSIDNTAKIFTGKYEEMMRTGLNKSNVITTNHMSESIRSIYDPVVYYEPDNSAWIKIVHHNNPASYLFTNSTLFETSVYIDANRWFNAAICDYVHEWELMIIQAIDSSSTPKKYRWIQYVSPMSATFDDVDAADITKITAAGYSASETRYGGIYKNKGNTFFTCNNGTNGNWWGAIGCWSAYQGGIPGYNEEVIKTGYLDLYLRIDKLSTTKKVSIWKDRLSADFLYEI